MTPTPRGDPAAGRSQGDANGAADSRAAAPGAKPTRRGTLNEAAHKLGYWEVSPAPVPEEGDGGSRFKGQDPERDVVAHASRLVLALGALGIVYGDIGTSPLYTVQTIFQQHADAATPSPAGVYGAASLIFWALVIVVSVKYAGFVMRAHNRGDGGVMALTALIQRRHLGRTALLVSLGIFGAGLFLGDGMITPAISVVSAVEGLKGVSSSLSSAVVPIALGIMVVLFGVQRFGTGGVGWMFGPVILLWFIIIGLLGAKEVVAHPGVLQGLSPSWGIRFMVDHGTAGFLTLGSVVLCVTGSEALYADRGHFGAGPIRFTWFLIVFPAVLLSYLGQGALILHHPHTINGNPFYNLVPHSLLIPMIVLATLATIIASQAAITGSFSVARQAVQLGFLPRLNIRHTSPSTEGQIYVPVINWLLAAGVVALIVGFQRSSRLTEIYGVAVTGTFILDTVLFLAVARFMWHKAKWRLVLLGATFLTVEVAFFSSNLTKVSHGAWIPLCAGAAASIVMLTWRKGREIVTQNREIAEGSLDDFLYKVRMSDPPVHRVGTVAVYLSPDKRTTPLALKAEVEHHGVFHDKVLIVSIESVSVPHVDASDRFDVETLGAGLFKVLHLTLRTGYRDSVDVPASLALARKRGLLQRNLDLEHASYFLSRITITPERKHGMNRWRKVLFTAMARNAASPIEHFNLPVNRTVTVGSRIGL